MWSIIDIENQVIGEWFAGTHVVPCYYTKKEALSDARKLKIRCSVIKSEIALTLPPSKHSKKQ